MNNTYSRAEMAKALNRSALFLQGLQNRFGLPVSENDAYPETYFALLRTLVYLRTLGISEDALQELWRLEKKILQLLHVDSTGSKTWYLDSCGQPGRKKRRMLLSNFDLGVELPANEVQLGLNFAEKLPELFSGAEMGEDLLRVLREYLKRHRRILSDANMEVENVRKAARWARMWEA